MALYPKLQFEPIVQVEDKTRLNAQDSFATAGDTISLIEIDAGDGNGYVDVTSLKRLDVAYSTDGDKTVLVRLNGTEERTQVISVLTEADDKLFSQDSDLEVYEPEILRYVRAGRNSYKDVHRRVQELILDWLDENRYWKTGQQRYVKADLVDIQDFKETSTYWALHLIYKGLSDTVDDIFAKKASEYGSKMYEARERGSYRLDHNADGTIDLGEKVDNWSKKLTRV
jgi:hypothetical protein